MKRTAAVTLLIFGFVGAVAGFLGDLVLTNSGRPTFQPSVMLPILLVALGVSCVLFAWPIRRAVTTPRAPRVDPFRAVRIAALAKASSLVGSLTGGAAVGLLVFQATRPVVPGLGSMSTVIATAVGGVVLVILALIAEHLCTLPKDPDEREPDAARPGSEPEF